MLVAAESSRASGWPSPLALLARTAAAPTGPTGPARASPSKFRWHRGRVRNVRVRRLGDEWRFDGTHGTHDGRLRARRRWPRADAPGLLHSEFASALRAPARRPCLPTMSSDRSSQLHRQLHRHSPPPKSTPAQHALQRPLTAAPSSGETGFSTAAARMETAFACLLLVSCGCRFCWSSTPGHLAVNLVVTRLWRWPRGRRLVWWPGLPAAVEEFVRVQTFPGPTCQRVKANHLPPAGLLFPLPVPSRRGSCISLDFLKLPTARSGHNFLQVHIDLLTA
jgi:hypothetical protein